LRWNDERKKQSKSWIPAYAGMTSKKGKSAKSRVRRNDEQSGLKTAEG
jgi:hypothetical protein